MDRDERNIVWFRGIVFITIIAFGVWIYFIAPYSSSGANNKYLKVIFFDIGQGDSVFIETPDGVQALIDGGPDSSVIQKLSKELGFFDHTLDVVLSTHPDKDHIAGLNDVLERYDVGTIITTENEGRSEAWKHYRTLIEKEGANVVNARRGQVFKLGKFTTLVILFPDRDASLMESNTSSIVLQVLYGDIEFLLTGDSPRSIENYLVTIDKNTLESEVLKLGHHGSDTSSSELFIDKVTPQFAVVSAGKDNRYGHPHREIIDMFKEKQIPIVSTMGEGNAVFYSDGSTVWQGK